MSEQMVREDVMPDCVLCPPLRFRFNAMAGLPGEPTVLAADGDFFLMPDLAPLVEGHVLLVTARHSQCAGAFDGRLWRRAWAWRDRVARMYRAAYGSPDLIMLEHGPGTSQGGGACIDHAHWHLLPITAGVRAVLEERGLRGVPATLDALRARIRDGRSYLLVEEEGVPMVYPGDGVPSQFLRWAVSVALGHEPGVPWRWQETFGLPGSRARFMRTLLALRQGQADGRVDSHQ
ncbi:HIT family protein [Spirillospora sp. CA-294931]|uniref:HIT family protein n=1 Tax=Spirillospora sp. CA-294931 TaxID=3240042 RepID=UPI003D8CF01E